MEEKKIKADIPVLVFQEDDSVIAYSPALDLSTCGATESIARERFAEAVRIFLTESAKMGTLDQVMEECGWRKDSEHDSWRPPVYRSVKESVNIPTGV